MRNYQFYQIKLLVFILIDLQNNKRQEEAQLLKSKQHNMYHQFVPIKSEISSNNQLQKLISSYNEQLKHQENTLGLIYTQNSIHVNMIVDNNKHNTRLYVLSNGKILRYDNENNSVCQILGLDNEEIISIKVLDIGEVQRYVLMTNDGVSVCTIRGDDIKVRVVSLVQGQQKMHQQQEQQASKSITINTIQCELLRSVFIQQSNNQKQQENNQNLNQHNEQDLQQQQEQENISNSFIYRQMFIINQGNNNQFSEKRDKMSIEKDDEFVLVVVVSQRGSIWDMAVYHVTVGQRKIEDKVQVLSEQVMMEKQSNKQITNSNIKSKQHCTIHPLLLSNNSYSIQFLITNTTTQLSTANFLFSRTSPLIKADHQICSQSNSFSIYFATQAICYWVEPQERRHHVFEFQFCVDDDGNQLKGEKKQWKINAPTLLHGKKKVLTPCRVYSLPFAQQSAILRYFNIKKTLSQELHSPIYSSSIITKGKIQSQTTQNPKIQSTIKITIMLNQNNENLITFLQTQLKITKGNNKQLSFVINQQNLSFYKVLKQPKFILRDVVLLDCIKKYAILLVNGNGLGIQFPDNKKNTLHQHLTHINRLKLIIINLTPNTTQTNQIASQFQFDYPLKDTLCNLSLSIPKQTRVSLLTPQLSSALINKPKHIEITYSHITDNQITTQLVGLVPKADIYLRMLDSVLSVKQNGQVYKIDAKEEDQSGYSKEGFMNSVIQLLSV